MAIFRSSENQTAPLSVLYSENPSPSFSPLSYVCVPVIHPLTFFPGFQMEKSMLLSRERVSPNGQANFKLR